MSKSMKAIMIAVAAVMSVLLVCTTAMSALMLIRQDKIDKMFSSFTGQIEDPAQEDDVIIAQQYVIKSTLPISDAYKSGDSSQLSDRDKETLQMAGDIIKEIITEDMTDYDKEVAVYKYLTSGLQSTTGILTVINTGSTENDNPHDVLKNRSAVCVGYATTFRLFMQMLGIDCKVVHSSSLGHSWDMVRLDDGKWYHTDCFMDSTDSNFRNFNMDDATCRQSHEWNTSFFPAADGKKYNYILSICEEIKDIYAIPNWVMSAVKQKKTAISCTFAKKIMPEDEALAKYMVEQLDNYISNEKFYDEFRWTTNAEGDYVLCCFITYNHDSGDSLTDKQKKQVEKSINDALNRYSFYDYISQG